MLLLARLLRMAYRFLILELRQRDGQTAHSSLRVINSFGANNGKGLLNVTLAYPLVDYSMRLGIPKPLLRRSAVNRRAELADYARSIHGARVPIMLRRTGNWFCESHQYIIDVAATINSAERETVGATRTHIFQQFAALLVTTNARCWLTNPARNMDNPYKDMRGDTASYTTALPVAAASSS